MSKNTFHIVSLGCPKNTVDADSMADLLTRAGYTAVTRPQQAQFLIVNTCGFINTARDESFKVLSHFASRKKSGQILIATGCLTQRYGIDVVHRVPGIDAILGTRRWMDIVDVVENISHRDQASSRYIISDDATVGQDEHDVPRVSIQGPSAYLKIADGCSRLCAYCAIPLIKGPSLSRPAAAILKDALYLQSKGIREVVLVAQNTTDYGHDLGTDNNLAHLLLQITAAVPQIDWIRLMYAYPSGITDELIDVMATHKQIVPYLDIPLQHAHQSVLRRMHRPDNIDRVYKTLHKMRRDIPGLALRSTFIVGYPGETENEFQTLLDFIEDVRFDKLGAFKFSFEPGTASEALGDTVPAEVKEERLKQLMQKQQQISLKTNQSFVGHNLDVLIEGKGDGISIGRSYRDAPEVDGLVIVESEIAPGELIPVRINEAMEYDLKGQVII